MSFGAFLATLRHSPFVACVTVRASEAGTVLTFNVSRSFTNVVIFCINLFKIKLKHYSSIKWQLPILKGINFLFNVGPRPKSRDRFLYSRMVRNQDIDIYIRTGVTMVITSWQNKVD